MPASTIGLMALRMRSAASSSSRGAGSGRRRGRRAGQRLGVDLRGHDVLGQLEVGGAGLLGLGDLERLAHDLGDDLAALFRRAFHLVIGRNIDDDVDVLVGLLVHALEVGLAGQRDERRAVEERVGDRGDEVRGARARACRGRRRRAGEAPVHVGHVGTALLVANRDEGDRRVLRATR